MSATEMNGVVTIGEDMFSRLWLRQPAATPMGTESDHMFMWLWWFCVVWFVGLMVLMGYWVVKYRRRPGKIAPVSAAHNTPLEIAWTIIPSLFLVYIFFRGFNGYLEKLVSPGDAMEVNVRAKKWSWEMSYPSGASSTETAVIGSQAIPVFYLPAEKAVRVKLLSDDVMHAFWVPDFRVKQDALPNRYMSVWFKANAPDGSKRLPVAEAGSADKVKIALSGAPYEDHWLFCAEYCGDMHSEMAAIIRIVPDSVFKAWTDAAGEGSMPPVDLGKYLWKTQCATCHSVDGSKGTGPTWKDMYGHEAELTTGEKVMVCDDYIRESIMSPQAKIVKTYENGNMPSFAHFNNDRINGLIAYMKTLSDKGGEGSPCEKATKK